MRLFSVSLAHVYSNLVPEITVFGNDEYPISRSTGRLGRLLFISRSDSFIVACVGLLRLLEVVEIIEQAGWARCLFAVNSISTSVGKGCCSV